MADYQGLCAVVTGGASGIGLSLAKAVATKGARVAIADIDAEKAKAAAASIGGDVRGYACDVSSLASVKALAQDVERDFGGATLVFANAGVSLFGETLWEIDPAEFDWMFDVNVRGVFNTVHAFAPQLIAAAAQGKPARFVITGSENSVGVPFNGIMTSYTATKHAVMALADGLRRDIRDAGVGVSILCPGPVNTNLWDHRRARPERYGGSAPVSDDVAKMMSNAFDGFMHPDETARVCLEGIAQDEFVIISDTTIRPYAEKRHAEVAAALDKADERLGAAS